jgi:ABC-type polysaccharide/polyol phosphate transport system ATPase subunit
LSRNTQIKNFNESSIHPLEQKQETALEINNVTVSYRSYKERPTTFKESAIGLIRHRKLRYFSTFDALKNVSLEVKKGTVMGIIGSNGAGKSTLLKAITGVVPPISGSIKVNGKLDSFIQLGAGFDAELNAIENIYLNCSLHQMSKAQIKERVPHILDFAELREFATTPIKYYSSGMYARLGFAVAIEREPDILLIDEVLAVGDERFKKKCDKVFRRYLEEKKTIVMVSHSLEALGQLADNIALLSKGEITFVGDPTTALEMYRDEAYQTALS